MHISIMEDNSAGLEFCLVDKMEVGGFVVWTDTTRNPNTRTGFVTEVSKGLLIVSFRGTDGVRPMEVFFGVRYFVEIDAAPTPGILYASSNIPTPSTE